MRTLITTLICATILLGCSSSDRLTEEESRKLDARLHFLFDDKKPGALGSIDVATQPNGTVLAGVIIHCSNLEDLHFLGDKVRTKTEHVATAKIGAEDIRRVLQLGSVRYVEASTTQKTQ